MAGSRGSGTTWPTSCARWPRDAHRGAVLSVAAARSPNRRILYGRRSGRKLRPGRAALFDARIRSIGIDPTVLQTDELRPNALFAGPVDDVWLEIGFGNGEHLAAQAAANPHIGIIGCEPYLAGVARLVALLGERGIENVRILMDDAGLLLPVLPEASIGRAFLLFPDPWPKTRHHKRRFVNAANIAAMARVLKDGAEWRLATDDMSYCRWMLRHLHASPDMRWLARRAADWRERPADWPETRYERKALTQGRPCAYLRYRRDPRGGLEKACGGT